MTIKDFMTHHHRGCDALLSLVEDAVDKKDFVDARVKYTEFKEETLKHFHMEEEYLFVKFEEQGGMQGCGPTQMMRMEHEQVRALFEKWMKHSHKKMLQGFFDLSESLMILLQQHNAKEEQMLYTMIQNMFADQNDTIVEKLMHL